MNVKQARRLRQELGYKPTDKREYESMVLYTSMGQVIKVPNTIVNKESTSRQKYRELKKEFKK